LKHQQYHLFSNQLKDIIDWLKKGDIVAITNKFGQCYIFHNKCNEVKDILQSRVIVVVCETVPGVLDEGEWEYYIRETKNDDCKCEDIISKINDGIKNKLPNVFVFKS
jgi:hypothetical protein